MNKVECHVTSCQYYGENLCSLDKIRVDGPAAKDKSQTCCLSFDEKKQAAVDSVGSDPQPAIQTAIKCKAENCAFNDDAKCEADCICVECSCANVSTKSGTECGSFIER